MKHPPDSDLCRHKEEPVDHYYDYVHPDVESDKTMYGYTIQYEQLHVRYPSTKEYYQSEVHVVM